MIRFEYYTCYSEILLLQVSQIYLNSVFMSRVTDKPMLLLALSDGMTNNISFISSTERNKSVLEWFIKQWREAYTKLHPTDADTYVHINNYLDLWQLLS